MAAPYWRMRVTGENQALFCWDAALAQALEPSLTYLVALNGTSEYPKIIDVTLVPDATSIPAELSTTSAAHAVSPVAHGREMRMLQMSALRATADVLYGSSVLAGELLDYAELLQRGLRLNW